MKQLTLYLACLVLLYSCKSNVDTNPSRDQVTQTFQDLLYECVDNSNRSVPGVSMSVFAPTHEIAWTGATGFDSTEKKDSLSANQPFRIASITKTFVAVGILRLHEQALLNIDDPITTYISQEHDSILVEGGYDTQAISIRHCLHHTSGLFDYAMGNQDYIKKSQQDPNKVWSRTEQLTLATQIGRPIGDPGVYYHYSDTGYILLGEIIERVTQQKLSMAIRELLHFDTLDMRSTWWEKMEEKPSGLSNNVHRYLGRLDATNFDASVDLYGGGGLCSVTDDLAKFIHALFNDDIFDNDKMIELLLSSSGAIAEPNSENRKTFRDYRMGLWKVSTYGMDVYMHSGLWGTSMVYVPELKCGIATNVTKGRSDRLLKKTILTVQNLSKQ